MMMIKQWVTPLLYARGPTRLCVNASINTFTGIFVVSLPSRLFHVVDLCEVYMTFFTRDSNSLLKFMFLLTEIRVVAPHWMLLLPDSVFCFRSGSYKEMYLYISQRIIYIWCYNKFHLPTRMMLKNILKIQLWLVWQWLPIIMVVFSLDIYIWLDKIMIIVS